MNSEIDTMLINPLIQFGTRINFEKSIDMSTSHYSNNFKHFIILFLLLAGELSGLYQNQIIFADSRLMLNYYKPDPTTFE